MDFGAELLPDNEMNKLLNFGKLVEKNEFDQIWVADHFNNRNIFCVLSNLAIETNEINLGPGVTNPYVIHPAESASAIQTINEISNGRAVFGIGAGDELTLEKIGLSWDKPLSRVKEAIKIIKKLNYGEKVDFEGEFFTIRNAELNFGSNLPKIPIYLGAQGPKMLKLAGKVADGALINASNPKDIEFGVKQIEKSEETNDAETKKYAHTLFSIGTERREARKMAKKIIPYVISSVSNEVLNRHNISTKRTKKIKNYIRQGKKKEAIELINEKMIDAFSVAGNVDDCIKRINELKEAGADGVVLGSPIGKNKNNCIKLVGKEIISCFN